MSRRWDGEKNSRVRGGRVLAGLFLFLLQLSSILVPDLRHFFASIDGFDEHKLLAWPGSGFHLHKPSWRYLVAK